MDKIKAYIKDHKVISVVIAVILMSLLLSPFTTPTEDQPTDSEESAIVAEPEQIASILEYELISEEDLSYAGCKRVGYRIALDGSQYQEKIDAILNSVIEAKKQDWDDLTIWAYDFSERAKIVDEGFSSNLLSSKEISKCN